MVLGRQFARLADRRILLAYWPWLLVLIGLLLVRVSKGAPIVDLYALLSRPFWPGTAQSEWVRQAQRVEDQQRIAQLELQLEELRQGSAHPAKGKAGIRAADISRRSEGWWEQLELGAGSLQGVRPGASVTGPGPAALVGRIVSVTPTTARVALLTDPASRVGVELRGNGSQGLLRGMGTSRPQLQFLDKDVEVQPGDVVVTSSASSLFPPGLIVGVIQSVDQQAVPAPQALVQLVAPVQSLDWVQVR